MSSKSIIGEVVKVLWLSATLALPVLTSTTWAQETREPQPEVANARWSVQGNDIVINFELIAPADKTYKISVVLRRESDKSFAFVPKTVSGAVGEGKYAGQREMRWAFRKDIPKGLVGNDFWFEISADEIIETGTSKFWYYAGGAAAVVAGGVVYYMTSGTKSTTPSSPAKLPTPPLNRPLE
jgi:hypothetical protein